MAGPFDNLFLGAEDEKLIPKPCNINEYLINGEIRPWTGKSADITTPVVRQGATERNVVIGSSPMMTSADAIAALDAAHVAYGNGRGEWPTMKPRDRLEAVRNFVEKLQTKRDEIAEILCWEICKTVDDSKKEVDRTITYINDTIKELKRLDNKDGSFIEEGGIAAMVRRTPLGVVLCAGPFNYPFNESYCTLIPALIMGNTVVFKVPRTGGLCHGPTQRMFAECFPKGVVNFVYGSGRDTMPPMMSDGRVNVFAFIGTSKASDDLIKAHPHPHRLRTCLGLDAKNIGIVLADADIPSAAKECIAGALSYNGQRCTALKMFFVHKSIADQFAAAMAAEAEKLPMGLPWVKGVKITPLPENNKTAWLTELVTDAVNLGAKVMNKNGGVADRTLFCPAVLYPANNKAMRIRKEEQFGPVVPIASYTDIAEVFTYLEESPYGQQASIFGTDPNTVGELIDHLVLQVARVNLNTQCQRGPDCLPFTARKSSAAGTLSVYDALRTFSIRSLVANKIDKANNALVNGIMQKQTSTFLRLEHLF